MTILKKILKWFLIVVGIFFVLAIMFGEEPLKEKLPTTHLSVDEPIIINQEISLVVTPPGDLSEWTPESFEKSYKTVKDSGANIAFIYWNWGELEKIKGEYDWSETDFNLGLIKKNDFKSAVVIKLIDTNQVGGLPKDIKYKSFEDDEFKV